jgi:hypothetical protein
MKLTLCEAGTDKEVMSLKLTAEQVAVLASIIPPWLFQPDGLYDLRRAFDVRLEEEITQAVS